MAKARKGDNRLARVSAPKISDAERRSIMQTCDNLRQPVRGFVQEIFDLALKARGRLDEDVYGVVKATLEALEQAGGAPPPIIFGVSHFKTGKVEQVGFMPEGMKEIPGGGRFITNYPALDPSRARALDPGSPGRLKG